MLFRSVFNILNIIFFHIPNSSKNSLEPSAIAVVLKSFLFWSLKITPVSGKEIFNLIKHKRDISSSPGKIISKDIKEDYILEVTKNIKINKDKKIKLVIDCGNGAAGCIAPELFKNIGCDVIELFSEVDGNFPNPRVPI